MFKKLPHQIALINVSGQYFLGYYSRQYINTTYFLGETDSSSIVASSSASRPKRSLLCFCKQLGHNSKH